jgi:hypothetical protein
MTDEIQNVRKVHVYFVIGLSLLNLFSKSTVISHLVSKWYRGHRFWRPAFIRSGITKIKMEVTITVNWIRMLRATRVWNKMKRYMGEWRYTPHILNFCSRWRWVVRFTHRPLYPWGESKRYLLDVRLVSSYRRQKITWPALLPSDSQ